MKTKFIPGLKFFTVATAIFFATEFNPLNADDLKECQQPAGEYLKTCASVIVTKKDKKKCRVNAICSLERGKAAISRNCFVKYSQYHCHAHWDWNADKPAPRLKNANGWLKPEK